jgi:hypothetical protein
LSCNIYIEVASVTPVIAVEISPAMGSLRIVNSLFDSDPWLINKGTLFMLLILGKMYGSERYLTNRLLGQADEPAVE